jgi:hypothetical protein
MVILGTMVPEYVALQSHGNVISIISIIGCILYGVVVVPVTFIGGPCSTKLLYAAFPNIVTLNKSGVTIVFPIRVLLRLKAFIQDLHVVVVVELTAIIKHLNKNKRQTRFNFIFF